MVAVDFAAWGGNFGGDLIALVCSRRFSTSSRPPSRLDGDCGCWGVAALPGEDGGGAGSLHMELKYFFCARCGDRCWAVVAAAAFALRSCSCGISVHTRKETEVSQQLGQEESVSISVSYMCGRWRRHTPVRRHEAVSDQQRRCVWFPRDAHARRGVRAGRCNRGGEIATNPLLRIMHAPLRRRHVLGRWLRFLVVPVANT